MKGVTGVWKDILPSIIQQGDVSTLLTMFRTIPALTREERADPRTFWRTAFSYYFSEYLERMDLMEKSFEYPPGFWRKMTLWLTWAHRFVLNELERSRAGLGFIVRVRNDQGEQHKDYTRVQLFGKSYTVPAFVRNVMKIPSGQLLNANDEEQAIPTSPEEMADDAARVYWTAPFSFFGKMKSDRIWFGDHEEMSIRVEIGPGSVPGGIMFFTMMLNALGLQGGPGRWKGVYDVIPDKPHLMMNPRRIYLGERVCAACNSAPIQGHCGRCNSVGYCSVQCQKQDWDTNHKNHCK